jgi:hypothetical protein
LCEYSGFDEAGGIEQQIEPLAAAQLPTLVLTGDRIGTAHFQGRLFRSLDPRNPARMLVSHARPGELRTVANLRPGCDA